MHVRITLCGSVSGFEFSVSIYSKKFSKKCKKICLNVRVFLVPMHFQVSGIVGRADLLCALFVFIAFLSYVRAVRSITEDYTHRKLGSNRYVIFLYFWVRFFFFWVMVVAQGCTGDHLMANRKAADSSTQCWETDPSSETLRM